MPTPMSTRTDPGKVNPDCATGVSSPAGPVSSGHIPLRRTSGAFLAKYWESLGRPPWFLNGTMFAEYGAFPETILVSDFVAIYGNIAQHADNPAYFIDYVAAGVPMFRGALDQGLRSAPDLRSALVLWAKYGSDRPGCMGYHFEEVGDWSTFWLEPRMELGTGRSILAEMPLLVVATLAARCLGEPARDARIELAHSPPSYAERFVDAARCRVEFNARRDAIHFPSSVCREPSVSHDVSLWRIAQVQCESELQSGRSGEVSRSVTAMIERLMTERRPVPRLDDIARGMGMAERTLIRRLRAEGTTYQGLADEVLKARALELLANHHLSIAQISDLIGLSDASGIYRRFQRWFGKTPDQMRRELTQA
jgi:AraC-like DNA-binding protein